MIWLRGHRRYQLRVLALEYALCLGLSILIPVPKLQEVNNTDVIGVLLVNGNNSISLVLSRVGQTLLPSEVHGSGGQD